MLSLSSSVIEMLQLARLIRLIVTPKCTLVNIRRRTSQQQRHSLIGSGFRPRGSRLSKKSRTQPLCPLKRWGNSASSVSWGSGSLKSYYLASYFGDSTFRPNPKCGIRALCRRRRHSARREGKRNGKAIYITIVSAKNHTENNIKTAASTLSSSARCCHHNKRLRATTITTINRKCRLFSCQRIPAGKNCTAWPWNYLKKLL